MTDDTSEAQAPHYTSDDWCTPKEVADELGMFELDPSSNPRSHIRVFGRRYQLDEVTTEQRAAEDPRVALVQGSGLEATWDTAYGYGTASVFCNPQYSNALPWCRRLADHDGPWCALLKLDTTTKWWATLMEAGASWAPFRHRLKFEQPGYAMTANFASVLVWSRWRPSSALASRLWMPTYAMRAA